MNKDSTCPISQSHLFDGSATKLKDYYRGWADHYNHDVSHEEYGGPEVMASIASMVAISYLNKNPGQTRTLDAGCGTGLVGEALVRHGFRKIDGCDLSQDMTSIAADTGVYHRLWSHIDLGEEPSSEKFLPLQQIPYEIVVCCGVFTLGHLKPNALLTLRSFIKPGGFLVVSTRNSYLHQSGYKQISQRLVNEGQFDAATCIPNAKYIAEEDAHYWIYHV
jgi:predicted TPR repeat methyltransferase